MQEDLQGVHHEEDGKDCEHVAKANKEEVEDAKDGAPTLEPIWDHLGEEDLKEDFTELSMGQ